MVTRNSRVASARNLKMKYFSEASVFYMFFMWMREREREREGGERERERESRNVVFDNVVSR